MVKVAAAARVSELTLIVCPEKLKLPALTVEQPVAFVDFGAVHPVGTATSTSPLLIPPVAAVYVNTIVFPVEPFPTFDVVVVSVPEPSAAYTLIDGELAKFVNVPPLVDISWPCHVAAPAVVVAVAPSEAVHDPPDVAP